jgi:hypothetical protein
MLRRVEALLCCVLLVGLLGACAMVDTVDPRYDSINRSTAKARNESILLNIVRASHSAPLNFVAFSKVSGTTAVSASAGLPLFNLGPFFPVQFPGSANLLAPPLPQRAYSLNSNTLSGSTNANNNFDISILETSDFYRGLLRPVDLPVLNFFIRQGYSRELLFWLFTESVRETIAGQTVEFLNDPDPRLACQITRGQERCFRHMVDVAMASGLTVETRTEATAAAGGGSKGGGKGGGKTSNKGGGDGNKSASGGGGGSPTRIVARFCFDPVLAARARKEYDPEIFRFLVTPEHRPRCKIDPWIPNPETDTLIFNFAGTPFGTIKYEIVPRSTFGIYQFLGRILALQQADLLVLRGTLYQREDRRILAVERTGTGGCLVDVAFEEEFYCIPLHGAENTKRIMGLLAQLVALNTSTLDLAITPTVRAIQ